MRYKLNTTYSSSEITSKIAESIDYSNNRYAIPQNDAKLFFGVNISDGFILAKIHDKNDRLKGITYRFKVIVKDGNNAPELHINPYPGIIHIVLFAALIFIVVGKDYRSQFGNVPWVKVLMGVFFIATVVIPNIIEYKSIKDDLLKLCQDNCDIR